MDQRLHPEEPLTLSPHSPHLGRRLLSSDKRTMGTSRNRPSLTEACDEKLCRLSEETDRLTGQADLEMASRYAIISITVYGSRTELETTCYIPMNDR